MLRERRGWRRLRQSRRAVDISVPLTAPLVVFVLVASAGPYSYVLPTLHTSHFPPPRRQKGSAMTAERAQVSAARDHRARAPGSSDSLTGLRSSGSRRCGWPRSLARATTPGTFSAAELLASLYYGELRYRPHQPGWPDRDRFVLSKGHAAIGLYPVLADVGFLAPEFARRLHPARQRVRRSPGHAEDQGD